MIWYWGTGVAWWGWLLMVVSMVAFWGFVIWGLVMFMRWTAGSGPAAGSDGIDPERILRRRFATGEIDEEEYRRRLEALRDHSQ